MLQKIDAKKKNFNEKKEWKVKLQWKFWNKNCIKIENMIACNCKFVNNNTVKWVIFVANLILAAHNLVCKKHIFNI